MKQMYPVILTPSEGTVLAYFPDFDAMTAGDNVADALYMAADAIGVLGVTYEDDGRPLPDPTPIDKVQKQNAEDIVSLVTVDFSEYRRKHPDTST